MNRSHKHESELFKNAQKPIESFLEVFYFRKISISITKALIKTNITPNHITLISFSITALAALFFALGDYIYLVIGGGLIQLSIIFDCVDGEIARLKSLQSKTGEFLDAISDQLKQTILFCGIGIGIYTRTHYAWVWILILFTVTSYHLIAIITLRKRVLDIKYPNQKHIKKKVHKPRYFLNKEFYLIPGGFSETLITIGALLNQLLYVIIIVSVIVYIYTVKVLLTNFKGLRD
jgi:CDP-L-myo-inositol myo-inositolphosphotransferase